MPKHPKTGYAHVDDFGAQGVGIAFDDGPAFRRARDSLGPQGGVIEMGYGTYYLGSDPLVLPARTTLIGKGHGSQATTAPTSLTFYGCTGIVARGQCTFRDFTVAFGENTNTGGPAIPTTPIPSRQWRPLRSDIRVGTHIVPVVPPNHFTERVANRPIMLGWSYRASKCAGSSVAGTLGTTGATEPTNWLWRNPKTTVSTVTVNTGTDVFSQAGHGYSDGEQIRFRSSAVLPAPLVAETNYFLRDVVATVSFKIAATSGGAAIDITSAGSGTLEAYPAIDMRPIVDGTVEWTPVLAHGFEICSLSMFENIHIHRFPGNGFHCNASVLYSDVLNTADPRLGVDYSGASLCRFSNVSVDACGGSGIYMMGYDASVALGIGIDVRNNHGFGLHDGSTFGGTWYGVHSDGNEAGYYHSGAASIYGSYCEATDPTFGAPVIHSQGSWRDGVAANFSGIQASPALAYQQGHAYTAVNDRVAPTVDMGWHFICDVSGATPTASTFTANAGTDTITQVAHGYANGWVLWLSSSGSLPAGLSAGKEYYVVNKATDTYQLALTAGGAAIDLTSAGSGTHTAGIEPTWKPGVSWYQSQEEGGPAYAADTFVQVRSGSTVWRAWASSQISLGAISTKGNGNKDATFTNRRTGVNFQAGGDPSTSDSVMGVDGGLNFPGAGSWKTRVAASRMLLQYNGSQFPLVYGGASDTAVPAGHLGFTYGVHVGGSSLAAWPRFFMVDAVPSPSTEVQGSIAWHADATSGQPFFWVCKADLTWAAGPNMP